MVSASKPWAASASAASRITSGPSDPRGRLVRPVLRGGGWVESLAKRVDSSWCTTYVRAVTYNVHNREVVMNFKRWLPTLLAFPLGGFLAFETLGSLEGPLTAAAGGLLAGAVIGAGQWLALRPQGIGRRWIAATGAAMAAGSALAAAATGAGTALEDLMLA